MDPIGTPIGAVSLLFQVFSSCVTAYKLLSEARDLEKKYSFLLVRFKVEQYRLLNWATVANINERDDMVLINNINRSVVISVLDQQYRLMMRFGRLDERLRPLAKPLVREEVLNEPETEIMLSNEDHTARFPQANHLLKRALMFAESTSRYPARLRWVFFDREKVEELLSQLNVLNKFLCELLDSRELEMLKLQQTQTHYQILQLNTKMDQLFAIIRAGSEFVSDQVQTPASETLLGLRGIRELSIGPPNASRLALNDLADLAKVKVLTYPSDKNISAKELRSMLGFSSSSNEETPLRLPRDCISFDGDDATERRSLAWYRPQGPSGRRQRIWIEWKIMQPQHYFEPADGPDPAILRRFEALVELLRWSQRVTYFRASTCLGYYLRSSSALSLQYGLVFQNPGNVAPELRPISLRQRLAQVDVGIPSLTDRVTLMRVLGQSVEKLHAVNWLHKGLRSENVIFFGSDAGHVAVTDPYLAGFDYSRPSESASMSEGPILDLAEDIYRHPAVQGGVREGPYGSSFQNHHDIYSLGIIFMEIAYWKPIEQILGVSDIGKLKLKDVLGARQKLLEGEHRNWLSSHLGNIIAQIIMACIESSSEFEVSGLDKTDGGVDAAKLQAKFYHVIVEPMLAIHV